MYVYVHMYEVVCVFGSVSLSATVCVYVSASLCFSICRSEW